MKVVVIGGRGNGTVIRSTVLDCGQEMKDVEFLGFLSDTELDPSLEPERLGQISASSVAGFARDVKFIFALQTVKKSVERVRIFSSLGIMDAQLATLVHPTAWVDPSAELGPGCVLMPLSCLGPDAKLGANTQMYAQSFVGHDTIVGPHVFIANNASVGGRVQIDLGAHIGSNSTIREHTTIGSHSIVGAGSVVLTSIPPGETWVGTPAKPILPASI